VPSIEDALRDMELQPLHDALRSGSEPDALREAAALLDVAAPADGKRASAGDAIGVARSIEKFVAASRQELARGRWIYEWRVDRVWPDADLIALSIDVDPRKRAQRANGKVVPELLRDDRFQRAIGVNEHDGVTWFNRERFEHAVKWLGLSQAAELTKSARKAAYRLDELEKQLSGTAKPPATRRVRQTRPRADAKTERK
jgi:hypothetical protein